MAAFTYTGTDSRYYPSLSLEAEPGLTAELDEDPGDGRWQKAGTKGAAKPATKDGE